MKKFDFLSTLSKNLSDEYLVTPLGYASREVHFINDRHENFYFLGSMGMPVPFGLGVALSTYKDVMVVEGDGSILMNLGCLSTVGKIMPDNLKIIILDNGCYDSTGGQTCATSITTKIEMVGEGCGIGDYKVINSLDDFDSVFKWLRTKGTKLLVVKLDAGFKKVPRLDKTPVLIKDRFMESIKGK